ncbi:hypothetical protein Sjap_005601 [Stephania japonica]|uniref:BHLH domain-containing protein n=1 Tax=Stephania japonica TaxID=461633 RepID=A0AAP0K5X1_9MAGN
MVLYPIRENFRGTAKKTTTKMSSRLKDAIKALCCSNGWCCGAFWRVNGRNPMLLTLEDAYFEEQMGCVGGIQKMFQQVHMLGDGIIGQTALSGEHKWMFLDALFGEWNPKGSFYNQETFQGSNSEFHQQFSFGIKTVAVISVAPQGVVQFGSTQKIPERLDFVNHARSSFVSLQSANGLLSEIAPTSLSSGIFDSSAMLASVVSSANYSSNYGKNKSMQDGRNKDHVVHPESSPLNLGLRKGSISQFPNSTAQAQVILSPPKMQLPQVSSQISFSSFNSSASQNPSASTRSSGGSNGTLLGQQMPAGMGKQESPNTHKASSYVNLYQRFQGEETLACLYSSSGLLNCVTNTTMPHVNKNVEHGSCSLTDAQLSSPLLCDTDIGELPNSSYNGLHPFPGEFRQVNATAIPSKANTIDNLSQWIAESLQQGNSGLAASLSGVASASSELVRSQVVSGVPINCPATSIENSFTTDAINCLSTGFDGKDKSVNSTAQLPVDNDLFDSLGLDFRQTQNQGFWDDIMSRLGNCGSSSLTAGPSECVSVMDAGSIANIHKGLLSDLGLEQLLEGFLGNSTVNAKPGLEPQLSTGAITGTESILAYGNQAQLASHSLLGGGSNDEERMNLHKSQKENILKSRVGSWIDDSYSINTESTTVTNPKKSEEQGKATKKRARPGESTRPRPKDRQQIQDRVKELREIVPNGAKCSIDALLDRTIKHMLFMQNVMKYAEKIKQADEPKIMVDASGVVLKDNSNGGGATWAFEVDGQTMVCPIIVEDLTPPGQMTIEMLCEERGFFLEIADIIRGFGLTILKGVMEVQETKIWARFIVEVPTIDACTRNARTCQQRGHKDGYIPLISSASTTNGHNPNQLHQSSA